MPEEEESNRPKLIVPESEGNKSQNRLLVPPSDQEAESSSPKPQLVAPIDQVEEPQVEEPQVEEPQVEEPQVEEPTGPVKVVEMSPPVATEEEIIGQLPEQQEDDWMKDAYEQVADADRATEVMGASEDNASFAEPNAEQPVEPVYQAPVESPSIAPQVAPTPQLYAQQQMNPYQNAQSYQPTYQNVQPYQQTYSSPPSAGVYPYQQGMQPNQQTPVGQPKGIPGPAWLAIGLIVGVAIALLVFKYMPLDWAASFRHDLVEKGKSLVIDNRPVQTQSVVPVVPAPQQEDLPSEPDAVPDTDLESE
ncbi:hypothetical protein N8631_02415 [Verrucomicrobiales bacterium]|nr:hypothetical protein [Verrucomicrobiales bacterium]